MKTLKTPFGDSLQAQFLKGAKIIDYHIGRYRETILIELPKDSQQFRFEMWQNFGKNERFSLAVSYNHYIKETKRVVMNDHYSDELHYEYENRRSKELKETK